MIAVDEDGWTGIMMAAEGGHLTCLQLLVDRGADVNATSKDGRTAIAWATTMGGRLTYYLQYLAGR